MAINVSGGPANLIMGLGTGAPWRENFGPPPVTPGAPISGGAQGAIPAIFQALQMQNALGQDPSFNIMSGAREGLPKETKQVEKITGQKDLTQNELAAMSRFPFGQQLAQSMGPFLASLANAVYTGDKALSQKLGREKAFIPSGHEQFGPTTSDASLGNFLSAQAGIMSKMPEANIANFIYQMLSGGGKK